LLDVNSDGSLAFVATESAPETSTGMVVAAASGEPVLTIDNHIFFDRAVFADEARTVMTSSEHGQLEIWDLASHRKLRTVAGSTEQAAVGATSASDGCLVVGTAQGELHLWEPDLIHYRGALRAHSDGVTGVKFSPDGKVLLSTGEDGTASLLDVGRGRSIATFGGPQDFVWGGDIAADNDHVLMSHMDGSVRVWSRYTWFPTQVLGTVARLSSDGHVLLTFGGIGESRRLIDLESGKIIATLPAAEDRVLSIAVDGAKQLLAVATVSHGVQFWDIASGKLVSTFKSAAADTRVVALSPDGKLLATAGPRSGNVLWDVGTMRRIRGLSDFGADVADLLFHPDGKRLFAASERGRVAELDLDSGRMRSIVEAVDDRPFESLALSRDGQQLLLAGGKSAELWDLQSESLVQSFSGHSDAVAAAAISSDGQFVVTGGGNKGGDDPVLEDGNEVIVWDALSGRELVRYRSAVSTIKKLAFGATSQDIVAVDEQARFYRCEVCVPSPGLAALAKSRAARELSSAERAQYGLNFGVWSKLRTMTGRLVAKLMPSRSNPNLTTATKKPASPPSSHSPPSSRPGQKRSLTY
jgi:WD40 repeat protein